MAYTVNKTSSGSYTVQDGVVNTQTDLSLIGKGYAGYGESIAENFLHLLENFSNTSAPTKPVQGQLWYDSTAGTDTLKVSLNDLAKWSDEAFDAAYGEWGLYLEFSVKNPSFSKDP